MRIEPSDIALKRSFLRNWGRGLIRRKTKREWEEIVAGVDKLRQAKEEKDGLGALREAERNPKG